MYVFLFVLVPLVLVMAWALAQDWKRRHRRHVHGADTKSGISDAVESAKGRATRWMLRVSRIGPGQPMPASARIVLSRRASPAC